VHILFLDESGKPDEQVFAVGGIAVRADRWRELRERWDAALGEHRWPDDREIKWHGMQTGEVPPKLTDSIFEAIAGAPVASYVAYLRPLAGRKTHEQLFRDEEATYRTALTFLAERFERMLAREDSYGVIVLDSRERAKDDRLRRFFERLRAEGTEFLELDRLVDSLLLGPSHFSIGLQVADLVVGSSVAGRRGQLNDASRWHKLLFERCFARHPDTGEVDGVGLKEFPPRPKGAGYEAKLFSPE
jgi:hypothetical protein